MENLKKCFPHAFKAVDTVKFITSLIIYALVDIVCGFVIGILAKLPLIGFIFALLGSVIGLYALVGVILTILVFLKVLNNE